MYRLHNVYFSYGKREVLQNLNFIIHPGEVLGIIGPNGSGKTTLLKILGGFFKPSKGVVWLGEKNLSGISSKQMARNVAVVPQEHSLVFPYTVMEVVLMGRYPHLDGWTFEGKEEIRIARQAMGRMDIEHLRHRFFFELSGGEKQRVIIARALTQQPQILLLDEPSTFLDLHHQVGILRMLNGLNVKTGLTIVMISHDLNMASQFCQRLLLLNEGKVSVIGNPEEVLTAEKIREIYRCEVEIDRHLTSGKPRVTLSYEEIKRN